MGRFEQILLIAALILLLFGSTRLPEVGKSLGQAIKEFKKAISGQDEEGPSSGEKGEKKP